MICKIPGIDGGIGDHKLPVYAVEMLTEVFIIYLMNAKERDSLTCVRISLLNDTVANFENFGQHACPPYLHS